MAARIRKELGVAVDEVAGAYGEFTVLVDEVPIRRGNPVAVRLRDSAAGGRDRRGREGAACGTTHLLLEPLELLEKLATLTPRPDVGGRSSHPR